MPQGLKRGNAPCACDMTQPIGGVRKSSSHHQLGWLPCFTGPSFAGADVAERGHWWRMCHTNEKELQHSTEWSGPLTFGESNKGLVSVATSPSLGRTFVLNRSRKFLKHVAMV